MFFGEQLSWPQAGGAALVIVAIMLVQLRGTADRRPDMVRG